MDPGAEEFEQAIDKRRATAAVTLGERIRAQEQHRAHDVGRMRLANADGMTDEQVALQKLRVLRRDAPSRQIAETSRDAINDLVGGNERLDDRAARRHP